MDFKYYLSSHPHEKHHLPKKHAIFALILTDNFQFMKKDDIKTTNQVAENRKEQDDVINKNLHKQHCKHKFSHSSSHSSTLSNKPYTQLIPLTQLFMFVRETIPQKTPLNNIQ